jgi:3-phenylpropionate/trans-cinnamate dioxygenase ferredoxin subunit
VSRLKAKLCKKKDVPPNTMKSFDVGGEAVLVAHVDGRYYCTADTCTHAMAYLSEGELLDGCRVQCPDHGAIFDLKTGEALALPAVSPVETHRVVIEGEDLFVEIGKE